MKNGSRNIKFYQNDSQCQVYPYLPFLLIPCQSNLHLQMKEKQKFHRLLDHVRVRSGFHFRPNQFHRLRGLLSWSWLKLVKTLKNNFMVSFKSNFTRSYTPGRFPVISHFQYRNKNDKLRVFIVLSSLNISKRYILTYCLTWVSSSKLCRV